MLLSHGEVASDGCGGFHTKNALLGFLRQNFATILKLSQSQAINTAMPKLGGGAGGGWFLAHHWFLIHLELGKHAWKGRANSAGAVSPIPRL